MRKTAHSITVTVDKDQDGNPEIIVQQERIYGMGGEESYICLTPEQVPQLKKWLDEALKAV